MNPEERIAYIFKVKSIDLVLTLPCIHIKQLILTLNQQFKCVDLTREEEGVGIAAGSVMAGKRAAMVIQSGGIGNSLNALMSLTKLYGLPLPILISWRGSYKENLVGQLPMGRRLIAILEGANIPYVEVMSPGEFAKIEEGITMAYKDQTPLAILISPRFFEGSDSKIDIQYPARSRSIHFNYEGIIPEPKVTRAKALEHIAEVISNELIITNIGLPSREMFLIRDRPQNFYMLGSFGLASSIGLGVSLSTEKNVLVLDGDGSLLTNPNALLSAGTYGSKNLTILALDNGCHGSTGMEKNAAYSVIDLEMLARASNIKHTFKTSDPEKLKEILREKAEGVRFIHFLIRPGNRNVPTIPLKPFQIRKRFTESVQD